MQGKCILFVDDDLSTLKMIHYALKKTGIKIFLSNSGKDALNKLQTLNIDMIVTDYKMSDIDGYLLLKKVKKDYPDKIRIMMCEADNYTVISKSIFNGVAKTVLAKPFIGKNLVKSVKNILRMLEIVDSQEIKDYIVSIDEVPTLPEIYNQLVDAVNKDKGLNYIAQIVNKEPSLAAQILKIVNSASFGLKTTSIQTALVFIGLDSLRDIILMHSVFNSPSLTPKQKRIMQLISDHALHCNSFLQKIYKYIYNERLDIKNASVGLVANIGFLIMVKRSPEKFDKYLDDLRSYNGKNYEEIDEQVFGLTHSKLGGYLFNWWDLPFRTVEIVLNHHTNLTNNPEIKKLSEIIHISDILAWQELGYLKNMDIPDKYLHAFMSPVEIEKKYPRKRETEELDEKPIVIPEPQEKIKEKPIQKEIKEILKQKNDVKPPEVKDNKDPNTYKSENFIPEEDSKKQETDFVEQIAEDIINNENKYSALIKKGLAEDRKVKVKFKTTPKKKDKQKEKIDKKEKTDTDLLNDTDFLDDFDFEPISRKKSLNFFDISKIINIIFLIAAFIGLVICILTEKYQIPAIPAFVSIIILSAVTLKLIFSSNNKDSDN